MMGPDRMYGMTPWVRRLLVANLLVFLLQNTILLHLTEQLGFIPLVGLQRPWTAVTYMFLHDGILHIAFNMLALFVFAPPVEERLGGRTFVLYYLLCGVGGAAFSYLLTFVMRAPGVPVVGASGAILGVALAFAWFWPDQPIFVFPFPEPIPAKWLVTFFVGVDLALALLPVNDGVAHLAHLGGIATGFVWLKAGDWRLGRAERRLRQAAVEPGVLVHPAARAARGSDPPPPSKPRSPKGDRTQAEVDRVLDKISARGMGSLTPAERKFLAEMSRKMRDRH
jgi:rhomboid family protein